MTDALDRTQTVLAAVTAAIAAETASHDLDVQELIGRVAGHFGEAGALDAVLGGRAPVSGGLPAILDLWDRHQVAARSSAAASLE